MLAARLRTTRLLTAVVGLVSIPSAVAAAELEMTEPALCTSVDELSGRVKETLGKSLADVPGPRFVVGTSREAEGFRARLEVSGSGASGSARLRTLGAPTCEALTDALSLAILLALGVDPEQPEVAVDPEASGSAPALDPALPDEPEPPPPAPPADAAGPELSLQASAVVDSGSLPGPALGVALGARLAWSTLELQGTGLLLPAREARLEASGAGGELGLGAGALLVCTPLSGVSLQISGCAGAEAGRLWGTGIGVASPRDQNSWWAALRVDFGAHWPLSSAVPLGVELTATAAAPLVRDRFVLTDIGSVHRPATVVGRASVGLRWTVDP